MSYDQHAKNQNAEAAAAYKAWIASMAPTERRDMRALKLLKPLSPHTQSGAVESQRADIFQEAAGFDDEGAEVDPNVTAEESAPATQGEEETPEDVEAAFRLKLHRALRTVVGELLSARNRSLAVECMALSTSIVYDGVSQTEIAAKYGITKAAVSRRCVELCERLGIEPPRGMRRDVDEAEAAGEDSNYDVDTRGDSQSLRAE